MKISRNLLLSLLLGSVITSASLAQDPAAPASEPSQPAITNPADIQAEDPAPATEHKVSRRRSSTAKDQTMIGSDLVVRKGEEIRDGVVIGGSAVIDGKVSGDLVVVFGSAKLGPSAELARDLTVVLGTADIDSAAKITGDRVILGASTRLNMPGFMRWPEQWIHKGLFLGRPLPHQLPWCWALAGLFLLLYLGIRLLFPRSIDASVQTLSERPGSSFFTGLLALMLVAPLVVILAITVIGIILIPFVACGVVIAFMFGKAVVYQYTGQQLGTSTRLQVLDRPLVAILIGALIFTLLYTIPVLGFLVWGAIAPLGFGAVLLTFMRRLRAESSPSGGELTGDLPPPVIPGDPTLPPGTITGTPVFPRVGFWGRLAATLIDLVLVGLIVILLNLESAAFLILWTAYHIGFWTWKGTTIGGMVMSLKITRVDGSPINLSVAVVRALSAFLSAAAFFIGFFWAGWNSERQAWHDKIANTLILRMPKGVALV